MQGGREDFLTGGLPFAGNFGIILNNEAVFANDSVSLSQGFRPSRGAGGEIGSYSVVAFVVDNSCRKS